MILMRKEHVDAGEWHDWYAWYPIFVESGECRWLENVQRKQQEEEIGLIDAWATHSVFVWKYRACQF